MGGWVLEIVRGLVLKELVPKELVPISRLVELLQEGRKTNIHGPFRTCSSRALECAPPTSPVLSSIIATVLLVGYRHTLTFSLACVVYAKGVETTQKRVI